MSVMHAHVIQFVKYCFMRPYYAKIILYIIIL